MCYAMKACWNGSSNRSYRGHDSILHMWFVRSLVIALGRGSRLSTRRNGYAGFRWNQRSEIHVHQALSNGVLSKHCVCRWYNGASIASKCDKRVGIMKWHVHLRKHNNSSSPSYG
jgi:hypothetical protein